MRRARWLPVLLLVSCYAHIPLEPTTGRGWRDAYNDCRGGSQSACVWAGMRLFRGGDPAGARAHWERACEAGVGNGCAFLGDLYEEGAGVEKDLKRTFELAQHGCKLESAHGCHATGVALYWGHGVARAPAESTAYYAKACAMGQQTACRDYGRALTDGRSGYTDLPRALELLSGACDAGDDAACDILISQLSKAKDATALDVAKRACRNGSKSGCDQAGDLLKQTDPALAVRYDRTACAWGSNYGCRELAVDEAEETEATWPESRAALTAACKRKDLTACRMLASRRAAREGLTDELNMEFERLCAAGEKAACSASPR